MRKKEVAVIIFARFPRAGEVKTRLAATLGEQKAAEFYKQCAEGVLAEVKKLPGNIYRYLYCADPKDIGLMRQWAGRHFFCSAQASGDLGTRMKQAFSEVFSLGFRKAIIIGTDVPDLSAALLREAIEALDSSDVTVGPSNDGGYYLLGIKRLYEFIFDDIPWSSSGVYGRTLELVRGRGLKVHSLSKLRDIDTEENLIQWSREKAIKPS